MNGTTKTMPMTMKAATSTQLRWMIFRIFIVPAPAD
jgi:hypothetical protein